MKPLIIIAGPTASGKSGVAVTLAKEINGAIISADSMQVYKGMNIGTAKIKEEEKEGIQHYLLDVLDPGEACSIVKFQKMVKEALSIIYANGKIPILVGGTGFYIQAIVYDIKFEDTKHDEEYRKNLESIGRTEEGKEQLHARLKVIDTASWELIHKNNVKRVIRAIEYNHLTGEKISIHNKCEKERTSPYNIGFYVLNRERKELYERIDKRVDQMFEEGLVYEVEELLNKGYTKSMVAMQALGYKEIIEYIEGKYNIEKAKEVLKRDTRHFAKRQLTWFKREKEATWINLSNEEDILRNTVKMIIEDIRDKDIINNNAN